MRAHLRDATMHNATYVQKVTSCSREGGLFQAKNFKGRFVTKLFAR